MLRGATGVVAKVQDMRDIVGPIIVNSGYRPPGYNAMIGGATHSRHMYGDAFDLDPVNVSLATLESACTGNDGFLVEYESHVHCDWRNIAVPEAFFGAPFVAPSPQWPELHAQIEIDVSITIRAFSFVMLCPPSSTSTYSTGLSSRSSRRAIRRPWSS